MEKLYIALVDTPGFHSGEYPKNTAGISRGTVSCL